MTARTYFRIQTADRDVADLLDPGYQFSHAYSGGQVRVGVSVCDSLEDLALYLASGLADGIRSLVQEDTWVIVEVRADLIPDAKPIDPEFEILVRPTEIVGVRPVDAAFVSAIAEADAFLATFDSGPDFDDDEE